MSLLSATSYHDGLRYGERAPASGPTLATVRVPSAMRSPSSRLHKVNADRERWEELPSAMRSPSSRLLHKVNADMERLGELPGATRPSSRMDARNTLPVKRVVLDRRTSNAIRPSGRVDATQGDDETTLGLLKVRVPGGKDVGWSQVRAGCSEEIAHAVAATIRIKFMQDEELEFVSHQASSFAFAQLQCSCSKRIKRVRYKSSTDIFLAKKKPLQHHQRRRCYKSTTTIQNLTNTN